MEKGVWPVELLPKPISKFSDPNPRYPAKAVILAEGHWGDGFAKTGHGVLVHGRRYEIVAVIDSALKGKDAGEVIGIGHKGVPIVGDLEEALKLSPDALIIGVATIGGYLPKGYDKVVEEALKRGLDIVSGLHYFISEDPRFKRIARKSGAKIIDVRKPPPELKVLDESGWNVDKPIITVMGSDCEVGKRTTEIELAIAAERKGIDVGWIATGQTGIMIGAEEGVVCDRLPSDFVPGEIERRVVRLSERGRELIITATQGGLLHPAYGQVGLGILYGSYPDVLIYVYSPRFVRKGFKTFKVPEIGVELDLLKRLVVNSLGYEAPLAGISINAKGLTEKGYLKLKEELESKYEVPVVDVFREGAGEILESALKLVKKGTPKKEYKEYALKLLKS